LPENILSEIPNASGLDAPLAAQEPLDAQGEVAVYANTSDMAGVTCRGVKETREG